MKRLKKIITVTIAMVMLFTMIGCGNTQATTSTSSTPSTSEVTKSANKPTEQAKPTQPVTKEAETKKVEPTTMAPTSAPTKAPEVTTEAAKKNVPLNAKIDSRAKVLAFSKDVDFTGFEKFDTLGFRDEVSKVTYFVENNTSIDVPSGSKAEFSNLSGFDSLSEELQETIMSCVGMICGDEITLINKNDTFTYALILCEYNENYFLYLYKK